MFRSALWASVLCAWLLPGLSARAADILVNTTAELTIAAAQAHPGDTIVMRDGVWPNADVLFAANGNAASPVTLRAQTLGAVHLTGTSRLRIAGNFLVVDGLVFTNGFRTSGEVIAFQDTLSAVANFSRMTNCVIVSYNPPDASLDVKWVSMFGFSNRVENCYFVDKRNLGTTLIVWVDTAPDRPNYHVIRHNYFGPRPAFPANGAETIRVGTSEVSMNLSRTTVEENYFEQCNGDAEFISNKSGENVYRHNTFVDCEGALSLRHGNRCIVEGNYFFGHNKPLTGGIRIVGEDHKVYNNYCVDLAGTSSRAPLSIMQGLVDSPLNGYFQVQRAIVAHNTFVNCANPLVVGLVGTLGGSTNITTLPPVDCVIANNLAFSSTGKLVDQRVTPVNLTWEGNILFGTTLGITNAGGITVVNPQLLFAADGLWRTDVTSPARGAAQGNYPFVSIDMEGQARPAAKDVGADQFSTEPTNFPVLRAVDVGPLWMRASGTVLSWATPTNILYGTALGAGQLNAVANVPGSFVYTPAAGTVLNAELGRVLTVVFTPVNLLGYSVVTQTVTINVLKATPAVVWPRPANIGYGIALGATQLNATASVPGSFGYNPASGTVLNVGSNQVLVVTFTPQAATNYAVVVRSNTITVLPGIPVVTWANPAPVNSGTILGPVQLNATANIPGTFQYAPPSGTVLTPGPQTLSVDFTPADSANYTPVTRTVTLDVTINGKFVPVITWANPADMTFGTSLGATQFNATAAIPGTFNYSPPAGTMLPVGNAQALSVSFTPSNTVTYTNATKTVFVNVAAPLTKAQLHIAYLIPTNRVAQAAAVTNLRSAVITYQDWFGNQMEQNGFARKTFEVETEPDGMTPLIHVVKLVETDGFLRGDIYGGRITNAARAAGLTVGNRGEIWWLIPETHQLNPDGTISGSFDLASNAGGSGDDPGWAVMSSENLTLFGSYPTSLTDVSGSVTGVVMNPYLASPEFYNGGTITEIGPYVLKQGLTYSWFEGSTFSSVGSSALGSGLREIAEGLGLDPDYRNDENFDGNVTGFGFRGLRGVLFPKLFPYNHTRLPYGASLVLSVSRYFNPGRPVTDTVAPTVTVTTSGTVVPARGLLRLSFSASDAAGLHAALLSWEKDGERVLVDEMVLSGTNVSRVFVTPYYDVGRTNRYTVSVYDLQGNRRSVVTSILPGFTVNRAPQPFLQAHPATAGPGEDLVLDASRTFDPEHRSALLEVEWDFDGDGIFDTEPTTTLTVTNHYLDFGNRLVRVRVTDAAGDEAISAPIAVDIVPCAAKLSPTTRTHGYGTGSGGITVTNVGAKCQWTAFTTNDWISITNGGVGIGPGRLTYAVTENPGDERVGTLFIGDATFLVRQSSYSCIYSLSPTSRYSGFGVGTGTIKVTTKSNCSWTVLNTNSWIAVTNGARGVGTGTVTYVLTTNRVAGPRTGYLVVADQLFLVGQWGLNCGFLVAPTSRLHSEGSETGAVTVTASGSCPWDVVNNNSWITIITPRNNVGSSTVIYSNAPNPTSGQRIGVFTVAGASITITQQSCSYDLSPTSRSHGPGVEVGSVTVMTGPTCAWSASSSAPWILINGGSGVGNGAFSYSLAPNSAGAARSGTVQLGSRTFSITQSGLGCNYLLTIDGLTADQIFGEGSELEAFHRDGSEIGTVDVTTGPDCRVTVDNSLPWVHILFGAGAVGNTTIIYTVDANPGNPREGFMNIAGQSFQVNQLGGLRALRAGDISLAGGGTNWIPITLDSHGTENVLNFSLCFDTNFLLFAGSRSGSIDFGGTLTAVSNQASQGRVGLSYALPAGWSIPAGNQTVMEVAFRAPPVSGKPMTTVSFCDVPSVRAVNDVAGQTVPILYQNSLVRMLGDCSLGESLDAPQFTWSTPATAPWACQTNATHDGEDAAASPILPDSGDSWIEATMNGPGTLTYWWKVSSEPSNDRLRLYMDGSSQITLSGEVDWQQIVFSVPAGSHAMRWRYYKNASIAGGQDRAWVDDVQFTPTPPVISVQPTSRIADLSSTVSFGVTAAGAAPLTYQWLRGGSALTDGGRLRGSTTPTLTISNAQFSDNAAYSVVISSPAGAVTSFNAFLTVTPLITLADAVDAPGLAWTTNASPSWIGQAVVTHDGVDAAQSTGILDNGTASLFATVTGPGVLTFWWKVSSEPANDRLRFYLNGTKMTEISGEVDWQQLSYTLGAGTQSIEWRYTKNASISGGQDRGWLDEVRFTGSPAVITTHPVSQSVDSGSTVTFNVAAAGSTPLSYRWRLEGVDLADGPGVSGSGTATLTLSSVPVGPAATYSVVVSNPFGNAVSSNAVLTVSAVVPLAEALDATGFNWITTGTPAWRGQTAVTHDGEDAAHTGAVADGATTTFQTTVTGPGSVSFWWKVSSEPVNDLLRFYLNGTKQIEISGEVDWQFLTYTLGSGSQLLEWRYKKSSSIAGGQDRGWVDQVTIVTNGSSVAPILVLQPVGRNIVGGTATSFSTLAVGSAPLGYQWQLNGTNLLNGGGVSGVTTANLAISSAQAGHAGLYTVVASNAAGTATSSGALLNVVTSPTITNQPASQNVIAGSTVNFTVGALGMPSLIYQWRLNGTNLVNGSNVSGATTAALKLTGVLMGQAGVYSVLITNTADNTLSADAVLTVNTSPAFTLQPVSQTVTAGGSVLFTAGANGTAPLSYQWRLNGANLVDGPGFSGATSASLRLPNVLGSQAGNYSVAASNLVGGIASTNALLTFISPPAITTQPIDQTVLQGVSVALSAVAIGTAPLGYQWRYNGTNLINGGSVSGANTATLTLVNAQPSQSGLYSVLVSNTAGTALSADARVLVRAPLSLAEALDTPSLLWNTAVSSPWVAQTNVSHDGMGAARSGTISSNQSSWIETTVTGPGVIRFWWKVSSQANADFLQFLIGGVQWDYLSGEEDWQWRTFAVLPGNQTLRWVYSKDASLSFGQDRAWLDDVEFVPNTGPTVPVIMTHPVGTEVSAGATVTFATAAEGTPPLSYQWTYNGAELVDSDTIIGSGGPVLTVANVTSAQEGTYRVTVRNNYSLASSSNAFLSVRRVIPLSDALDTGRTNMLWITGGYSLWFGQDAEAHDRVDAAQSGVLANNTTNYIETSVAGPIAVSFWWKASSQTNSDRLRFYINGVEQGNISGEVDWRWRTFSVDALSATLRWAYTKDASGSAGLDRGWIDEITSGPLAPMVTNGPNNITYVDEGTTVKLRVAASGTTPFGYQWRQNYTNLVESTNFFGAETKSTLIMTNAQAWQSGIYSVLVSNLAGVSLSKTGYVFIIPGLPLPAALNTPTWIWRTGGEAWWLGDKAVSHDGVQAARNGALESTSGSTWMETTLIGPGTLTYWWRVSSRTNQDFSRVYIDGVEQANISGERAWHQRLHDIDVGSHIVRWDYARNGILTNGQNRAYVDEVFFGPIAPIFTNQPAGTAVDAGSTVRLSVGIRGTPPLFYRWRLNGTNINDGGAISGAATSSLTLNSIPTSQAGNYSVQVSNSVGRVISTNAFVSVTAVLPLADALDTTNLTWTTSGNGTWVGQPVVQHDGVDAARIAGLLDSQSATFQTTVTGPGTVSFWWKVSSEAGKDFLRFFIGSTEQGNISGEIDWQFVTYTLPAGSQTLKWTYAKNGSLSAGQDRAWVDQVVLGSTPPAITTHPASQDVDSGATVTFNVVATGTPPLTYQWRYGAANLSDGGNVSGATTSTLRLTGVVPAQAGNYSVIVRNGATAAATSSNAALTVATVLSLAAALDTTNMVWATNGTPPWVGQNVVSHDGTDAARSGAIPDSGTTGFSTTVAGPGTLTFWWKVSSQAGSDRLRLFVNGTQVSEISGEVDWTLYSQNLGSGTQTLEWRYTKNSSVAVGQDRAWVDEVKFGQLAPTIAVQPASQNVEAGATVSFGVAVSGTPAFTYQWRKDGVPLVNGTGISGATTSNLTLTAVQAAQAGTYSVLVSNVVGTTISSGASFVVTPIVTLAEALDNSTLTWTISGTPPWVGQGAVSHDGTDAARSGAIVDSGSTSFSTTVAGPGTLTFWWMVSSESGGDFLRLYLNGTKQTEISGEVDWLFMTYALPSGTQTLEWRYKKNASVAAGQDRGWVDQIAFGAPAPVITTQPVSRSVIAGASVAFNVVATGTPPLTYQWRLGSANVVNGPNIAGATTASLSLTNVQPSQAGDYSVVVTSAGTSVISSNASLAIASAISISLTDALDATNLIWTTGGSVSSWSGQTVVRHDGVDAAESGPAADSQYSFVKTTVTGPGVVSFWWKVSSEATRDFLRFMLNGLDQFTISGEVEWEFRTFNVPSGPQELQWRYSKNSSLASGQDRGWVDQVVYTPDAAPSPTPTPPFPPGGPGPTPVPPGSSPAPVVSKIEVNGTRTVLTWEAQPTLIYQVVYKDDLADPEWIIMDGEILIRWKIVNDTIVSDSVIASLEDVLAGKTRYYRVIEYR